MVLYKYSESSVIFLANDFHSGSEGEEGRRICKLLEGGREGEGVRRGVGWKRGEGERPFDRSIIESPIVRFLNNQQKKTSSCCHHIVSYIYIVFAKERKIGARFSPYTTYYFHLSPPPHSILHSPLSTQEEHR